jgi:hypothetical protein
MKRTWALLLAVFPLATASPQESEVRAFTIRSEKRSVTVSAENRWLLPEEASSQPGYRNGEYRQSLELDFSGSIYHPNLLTYALATKLGVSEWEGGLLEEPVSYGLIADVHFLASLLREKPYPLSFHFDRRDDLLEYGIFDRVRVAETVLGGNGHWENPWVPLSLSVEQTWKEEHQASRSYLEDALVLRAGLEHSPASRRSFSRLDYTYSDFDRRTLGLFSHQGMSHEARLANNFAFGGGRHRLSSSLRYLNLSGTLQENAVDLGELLELGLPWGLSSQASYALRGAWSPFDQSLANHGRIQLRHQLYESLTSTLGVDGSLTSASSYRQAILGPDLDLAYRKNIRIGYLKLDYRLDTRFEDRAVSAQTVSIANESHILEDTQITFLDRSPVDRDSIRVTDATGTVVYLLNLDYTVTEIAGRIQLRRVASGAIPNGGTVLVDYTVTNDPSFQSFLLAQTAGVRFELFEQLLSIYYRYRGSRHPYSVSAQPLALELTDDHLLGLAFNLPPLQASAEYEHHGSSLLPHDALRGRQGLSLSIGRHSRLGLQGTEGFIRFASRNLSQGFLELTGRYSLSAGRYLTLSAAGGYRLQAETGRELSSLWSARAGLDFQRGLLLLATDYEYLGRAGGGGARQDHALSISLTRRF